MAGRLVDWDDDQVHNDYSTESVAAQIQTDPTDGSHVWFINGSSKLVHYNLNNKTQYENGTTQDYQFYNTLLTTPENFLVIPGFTHTGGTITVKPHMLVLTSNTLVSWFVGFSGSPDENDPNADVTYFNYTYPFADYPSRTVYAEITGQAAVVGTAGSTYFGD